MQLTQVLDLGDDRLEVRGLDTHDNEIVATGWVSAMENWYPDSAYLDDGHRDPEVEPKAMTKAQRQTYWLSLLEAAAPAPAVEPTVLFEAPTA